MKKTIGIIGGMGPLATCDLMEKIIRNTKAQKDQEHIHILTDCNTGIPDRTQAILNGGEDPVPEMTASAVRLEQMGADLLIMPCNTAHYYYDQICAAVRIPVLHMPRETASLLRKKGIGCAAVFATDGTIRAGIYEDALCAEGIRPVYPGQEGQRLLMKMIYDHIKAGKEDLTGLKPSADALLREMKDAGAQCFILGCTELPIAFELLGRTEDTFDPTCILARAAIKASGYEVN